MKKAGVTTVFKSYDEYLAHYNAKGPHRSTSKNKIFIKGENIALTASRKVIQELEPNKAFSL